MVRSDGAGDTLCLCHSRLNFIAKLRRVVSCFLAFQAEITSSSTLRFFARLLFVAFATADRAPIISAAVASRLPAV